MKSKVCTLMLGVVVSTASPVFAMEEEGGARSRALQIPINTLDGKIDP